MFDAHVEYISFSGTLSLYTHENSWIIVTATWNDACERNAVASRGDLENLMNAMRMRSTRHSQQADRSSTYIHYRCVATIYMQYYGASNSPDKLHEQRENANYPIAHSCTFGDRIKSMLC